MATPKDPRFEKQLNNKAFNTQDAMLIARNTRWRDQPGWLYLWNDEYVIVHGKGAYDAQIINQEMAEELYGDHMAEPVVSRAKAFAVMSANSGRDRDTF
jgi:hypothetical protein